MQTEDISSHPLSEALLANRISCIGGCFIPPVIITIIPGICHYRVPKFVYALMALYSIIVYSFMLTTGYNDLYYSDASLVCYNGASVLKRSYGPFHILFTILLYSYLVS
ncbi:MAG: histidine kinase N-terminal 7TM domain-containing protein [Oscillospiraceae bacterium]